MVTRLDGGAVAYLLFFFFPETKANACVCVELSLAALGKLLDLLNYGAGMWKGGVTHHACCGVEAMVSHLELQGKVTWCRRVYEIREKNLQSQCS